MAATPTTTTPVDRPKVVALQAPLGEASEQDVDRLSAATELTVVASLDAPAVAVALGTADGLLVSGLVPVTDELLDRAPRLQVVAVRAVGHDNVDLAACAARGIVVTNTPGVLEGAVADHTMALLLSLTRRLPQAFAAVRDSWPREGRRPPLGTDIRGKTLGIIGFGRIGQTLARTAHDGFGMAVLFEDRGRPPPVDMPWARPAGRTELLQRADVVSIHVPRTPETEGMIGHHELQLMQPGAHLVCTARGGIVDEAAVAAAVRAGGIAGAALDVMATEPYPVDGPLHDVDGIVLTPHVASATHETRAAMTGLAIDNLLAALAGQRPPALVTAG